MRRGGHAEFAALNANLCTTLAELETGLAEPFDLLIVDASLGDGWPSSFAAQLIDRLGRHQAAVFLFDQPSDLLCFEGRSKPPDVWGLAKPSLRPDELSTIAAGLALLKRVRGRCIVPN